MGKIRSTSPAELGPTPSKTDDATARADVAEVGEAAPAQRPETAVDDHGEKNRGGRPEVEIDEGVVAEMAEAGCKNREIAAYFQCSSDTVERRFGGFAGVLAKKRAERKWKLRAAQYAAALKGNGTLLIFLGKQELGQFDMPTVDTAAIKSLSDEELEAEMVRYKLIR